MRFPSQARVKWTPLLSPEESLEANAKNRSFSTSGGLLHYSTLHASVDAGINNGSVTGSLSPLPPHWPSSRRRPRV